MTTTPFQKDLISEIFGERPELALLGNIGQSGLGQSQQRFLRGNPSEFLGRLQQKIGQQLVQGGLPTLTPESFFGGLNFRDELSKFSPVDRGLGTSQFAPRTQFRF